MKAAQDLFDLINMQEAECLNVRNSEQAIARVIKQFNNSESIESDVDEQILLFIPFTQKVKLYSIHVFGPDDGTSPKDIKLFVNRRDIGFSDVNDLRPIQQLTLSDDDVVNGEEIKLRYVLFQNVDSLVIFIQNNQADSPNTIVHRISLFGMPAVDTNMSDFKRVSGQQGEENPVMFGGMN
ncbi:thioredoxin like 1 [Anaeramoeba ignava]|uniref:Thioredoxin like 1 n=1 Tax=Anaeramoeba ignava TaxID=1746090 RepID=A0A9Q0LV73_ANAIG|nr:thioredoxin like 1 [Anaeramoeba ignava]|eukprot:Anaeramoba_ignava/a347187_46.p1 GENE.a347187_46~~a347187_46.p1  ORF type:complete len:181 (-),score=22.21 a347187_46:153-695(-)